MSDRPILFSAPMVKALLAGTKTQTRRVLKPQPMDLGGDCWQIEGTHGGEFGVPTEEMARIAPDHLRIQPGDRLWVREAWRSEAAYDDLSPAQLGGEEPIRYEADGHHQSWGYPAISRLGRYRPGMFMPRWASRLTLIVEAVKVERLHDISEVDAIAEGIEQHGRFFGLADAEWDEAELSGAAAYRRLWTSINGAISWDANPWVGCYQFSVIKANIDAIEASPSSGVRTGEAVE